MKMPKSPPNLNAIYEKIKHKPDRFFSIYDAISISPAKKYLHWDKLLYYPPPEGFSHEEWWFALKRQRQALYKPVPLRDKEGISFRHLEVEPIPERLHKIDQGAGATAAMHRHVPAATTSCMASASLERPHLKPLSLLVRVADDSTIANGSFCGGWIRVLNILGTSKADSVTP